MKIPVRITIQKESPKSEITSFQSPFDVTETTTVVEFKTTIKNTINLPFEVVSDTLYNGVKVLKDSDSLLKVSGLEYRIIVK